MKRYLFIAMMVTTVMLPTSYVKADPPGLIISLQFTHPEDDQDPLKRAPILVPVLYIDGYTLTAGDNTLGSTIRLLDANDNVVFSTYVSIEGDIELPETLSGTYTIEVVFDNVTFVGEIEL
jgi:hypothetical protein